MVGTGAAEGFIPCGAMQVNPGMAKGFEGSLTATAFDICRFHRTSTAIALGHDLIPNRIRINLSPNCAQSWASVATRSPKDEQFQIQKFCHHKLVVDRSSPCPALKSNFKAHSENPLKRVIGKIFPNSVR
jgi:hypothetical protein